MELALGESWCFHFSRKNFVLLLANLALFFVFPSGKIGFMCIKHWERVFFLKIYRQDFKDFVISFNAFFFHRFVHFVFLFGL